MAINLVRKMQSERSADSDQLPKKRGQRGTPKRARVDGRRREARRLRELISGLMQQLNSGADASPLLLERVHRAAELCLLAEKSRALAMRHGGDLNSVIRLENVAARALKLLAIPPARKDRAPGLQEYLQGAR